MDWSKMSEKMNCKELSKVVEELRRAKADFDKGLAGVKTRDEIRALARKLIEIDDKAKEALAPFEMRLNKEQIKEAQEFYDFLGMPFNIEQWKEKVLMPTHAEYERARQNGYTEMIILPPNFANDMIEKVGKFIKREFFKVEIANMHDNEKQNPAIIIRDWNFESQNKNVDTPYAIMMKPAEDLGVAHPETMYKSPQEIEQIINDHNVKVENGGFLLEGLWLEEYLIFQMWMYYKGKKLGVDFHPDSLTSSFLINEKTGIGYLFSYWDKARNTIFVNRESGDTGRALCGARLAVWPKSVMEYLVNKNTNRGADDEH